jgi:hypothetical protein
MHKRNCWEVMKCGREPGGSRAESLGVCPAATEMRLDGVNHGENGGRACWGVPNTHCVGSLTAKFSQCLECPFFLRVEREENRGFVVMGEILRRLRRAPAAPGPSEP